MRLLALLSLVLLVDAAAAQRPSTLNMTCAQAQNLVASRGAVVLSTGPHTFDRFVSSPGYCAFGEYAYNASAPTRDYASCRLGYRCDSNPPLWGPGLFGRHGLR